MSRTFAIALATLLYSCGLAHAVEDCEMNGEHVNPANGSTYAGKSGIMKCRDRDSGKLVRETEYRNGRALGYRKSIDFSGRTIVGSINENGNRDGESKSYDAAGTLIAEERYLNGDLVGLQTYYHANKQVRRRSFHEPRKVALAAIEYNDRGQLTEVRCADKPLLNDDRALCGFDGKASEVTLYDARGQTSAKVRFENGRRLAYTAFGSAGTVSRSDEVKGEQRILREHFGDGQLRLETVYAGKWKESEREHAKSGQRVRETQWQQGRRSEESLWYLNGHLRSRTRWSGDGDYVQQLYDDAGLLRTESTYQKERMTRRKTFKDGKLATDEELYEDGSRKSLRKAD